MPNLTVTADVDNFWDSANRAEMRTALDLGNINNTSDANKPVSTAQQTALDAKLALAGGVMTASIRHTETTSTPSGTTQTINLNSGNHQSLSLASTTGDPTVTLTVPTSASSAGTLVLTQHGTTARDVTWAVSTGSIKWCGTEPTWASDAVSAQRVISWRWNGSVMFLASTEVAV